MDGPVTALFAFMLASAVQNWAISGIGEMPLTELAQQAFKEQIEAMPGSEYLFPTPDLKSARPYITTLKTTWERTLKRAGVPYFPLYHLRHTFASRLSAGGLRHVDAAAM